jgi:hypothetical protein
MTIKEFGFFRRMAKDDAIKELNRLRSAQPRPNEDLALGYLKGGTQILMVPAINNDLLAENRSLIGPPNIFTDGIWIWNAEVIFYVEKYHIEIPEELRLRMEQNEWICPSVTGELATLMRAALTY